MAAVTSHAVEGHVARRFEAVRDVFEENRRPCGGRGP